VSASGSNESERLTVDVPAVRYSNGTLAEGVVTLAREVPYTLFVNDEEILSIATLPSHLRELFIGFLVSEGVLVSPNEVAECIVDHGSKIVRTELNVPPHRLEMLERKGMLTSGCAGGLVFSTEVASRAISTGVPRLKVPISTILDRTHELDTYQGLYRVTRGVHAASVAEISRTITILEDLGRHNAVDKIVGYCFLNGIQTDDKLLLTTGRITSEVLTKAARSRFPLVVSRSSSSALATSIAKVAGIDLVTYVRGKRFNYFCHGATELLTG